MADLARAAEIDQGLLSKIERGLRPPPQIVPYVQRIAERFKFQPASKEYEELVNAAYHERFKQDDSRPVKPIPTITFLVSGNRSPVRGLSGLPPELTRPPSLETRHHPSQSAGARRGLDPALLARQTTPPLALGGGLSPLQLSEAMTAMLASTGLQIVSFQQRGDRFQGVIRTPDGKELEIKISPKRQRNRKTKE
jgi:hypothetical protein